MKNSIQFSTRERLVLLIDDSFLDSYIDRILINKYSSCNRIMEMKIATDALDYLFANKENLNEIPDVIFLDINMPIMNGFEFLEKFNELPASVKSKCSIYMKSSSFDPESINRSTQHPFVKNYIEKPLTKENVTEIFAEV